MRIPEEMLRDAEAEAKSQGRSVSWYLDAWMWYGYRAWKSSSSSAAGGTEAQGIKKNFERDSAPARGLPAVSSGSDLQGGLPGTPGGPGKAPADKAPEAPVSGAILCATCGKARDSHIGEQLYCNDFFDPQFVFTPQTRIGRDIPGLPGWRDAAPQKISYHPPPSAHLPAISEIRPQLTRLAQGLPLNSVEPVSLQAIAIAQRLLAAEPGTLASISADDINVLRAAGLDLSRSCQLTLDDLDKLQNRTLPGTGLQSIADMVATDPELRAAYEAKNIVAFFERINALTGKPGVPDWFKGAVMENRASTAPSGEYVQEVQDWVAQKNRENTLRDQVPPGAIIVEEAEDKIVYRNPDSPDDYITVLLDTAQEVSTPSFNEPAEPAVHPAGCVCIECNHQTIAYGQGLVPYPPGEPAPSWDNLKTFERTEDPDKNPDQDSVQPVKGTKPPKSAQEMAASVPGVMKASELPPPDPSKKPVRARPITKIKKPTGGKPASSACPQCGGMNGMHQKFCKAR